MPPGEGSGEPAGSPEGARRCAALAAARRGLAGETRFPPRDRAEGEGGRVRVAVVGGTGSFGQAVARRLAAAGVGVVIGSRDAARARAAAAPL
ncbi:MAG: NAD(P)-binding domain-containing protein, partial [Actinobacteria bacterium]|nr:NAD(P)-binding domain-containing protein [Actinomycetota bacterium]